MIHYLLQVKQFIPNEFHHSFFDIDFKDLYNKGYRYIITDLDNTLISYDEKLPTKQIHNAIESLKSMGFSIVLLSNNHQKRIQTFVDDLDINGYANARKPLLVGLKKALKSIDGEKDKTVVIGDQVVTDILGANRFNTYSILVNPLKKKTEKWYTKINRRLEYRMLDKLKRQQPDLYESLGLKERI